MASDSVTCVVFHMNALASATAVSYKHKKFTNLFQMLAVVYDTFTRIEKEKFRRLFLHKRKAAQHAFRLLVTDVINLFSCVVYNQKLECYWPVRVEI